MESTFRRFPDTDRSGESSLVPIGFHIPARTESILQMENSPKVYPRDDTMAAHIARHRTQSRSVLCMDPKQPKYRCGAYIASLPSEFLHIRDGGRW